MDVLPPTITVHLLVFEMQLNICEVRLSPCVECPVTTVGCGVFGSFGLETFALTSSRIDQGGIGGPQAEDPR